MTTPRASRPLASMLGILYRQRIAFVAIWLIASIAGIGVALATPILWPVTTTLSVREETGLRQDRPGAFASNEAARKAQETLLQLVTSTAVVREALSRTHETPETPSPVIPSSHIEKLQRRIRLAPPKGVDWGLSEVLYFTVKDEDPRRAEALSKNLIVALDERLRVLRRQRAQSLASELEESLRIAEADLNNSLQKIGAMESELGADLAEMRIMTEPSAGESNLRRTLTEVENELRQTRAQLDGQKSLYELLEAALNDPERLIATPSRLLESQPSLRKLKEGIVEAENRTALLLGNLHESHPKVQAAKMVESQARKQLHTELHLAIEGVKVEMQVAQTRLDELLARRQEIEERLARLAEVRAEYGLLSTQVKDRGEIVKRMREQLADVRSSLAAAETSSVLAQVSPPQPALRAEGPGMTTRILLAIVGGAVIALGALLVVTPSAQWKEVFGFEPAGEGAAEADLLASWLGGFKPRRPAQHTEQGRAESGLPTRS